MESSGLTTWILESSSTGLPEALHILEEEEKDEDFAALYPSNRSWSNNEDFHIGFYMVGEEEFYDDVEIRLGGSDLDSLKLQTDNYSFTYRNTSDYPESKARVERVKGAPPNELEEALLRYTMDNYRPQNSLQRGINRLKSL